MILQKYSCQIRKIEDKARRTMENGLRPLAADGASPHVAPEPLFFADEMVEYGFTDAATVITE